jgi:hypothetical protein
MRETITSAGKRIHVYDDLVTFEERTTFLNFFRQSYYKIDGGDNLTQYVAGYQIYSAYSLDDLDHMKFTKTNAYELLNEKYGLQDRNIKQVRVNHVTYGERNSVHQDNVPITLMYYANLEWDVSWGGHTFFLNEPVDEIYHTVTYKPGRIVVFDGTIPHMIMSTNTLAEAPRLSFVIQYDGEKL